MKVRCKHTSLFVIALVFISLIALPNLTGNTVLALDLKYDFGTATSPLQSGYARVTRSTLYTSGSYGWLNITNMEDMDRGTPADYLKQDFCFYNEYFYGAATKIFRTDIANGYYLVEYMMGDSSYAHDYMNIKANGVLMTNNINTNIGQFVTGRFTVTVSAGNLQLEFSDDGGVDPSWVINSIVITPLPLIKKYDFGTSTSPLETGYTRVTGSTLYTAGSYGWTSNPTNIQDVDRGAPADNLKRDLCFYNTSVYGNQPKIFRTDIINGMYMVEYTMGDNGYAHDNMNIKANGILVASNINTSAGQFISGRFFIKVTSGNLQLEFSDAGGVDPCWVINSIIISPNIAPQATVTASSTYPGYSPYAAVDEIVGGYSNDWASNCEKAGAWLKLNWNDPRVIKVLRLRDRPNLTDGVWAFSLYFNNGMDGYLELPNDGTPQEIKPPVRPGTTTDWLEFSVDQANPSTYAVGLGEIEVYE